MINKLQNLLSYDAKTGVLLWRNPVGNKGRNNGVVGYVNGLGYRKLRVGQKEFYAHRIAWALHYGSFPTKNIDHVNGNRLDNRIVNLREATESENAKNSKLYANNKSGIPGVNYRDGAWNVYIKSKGEQRYLGRSQDFFEACCIRKSAENAFGFHVNHGREQ